MRKMNNGAARLSKALSSNESISPASFNAHLIIITFVDYRICIPCQYHLGNMGAILAVAVNTKEAGYRVSSVSPGPGETRRSFFLAVGLDFLQVWTFQGSSVEQGLVGAVRGFRTRRPRLLFCFLRGAVDNSPTWTIKTIAGRSSADFMNTVVNRTHVSTAR